mmetsp:Transcript_93752/g.262256  ORF Transcript_93752/g.262256 Transcript_93752/m.262256 type:complete len:446 (-) Transcript_93752:7-1344(-)
MVEVKFDAVSKMDLSDCYVAVRIGEVQKLARLPASKALSFPKAGDRHFGKVEVYRRIGGCGVDFDPMKPGDRQVSMDCGAAGDLRLNIAVEGTQQPELAAASDEATAVGGTRAKAAKEYLRKHSVELQLSEAMQALLKEKPDDPINFLVNKLLGNQGVGVPARKKASSKAGERARARSTGKPAKLGTIKEKAGLVELEALPQLKEVLPGPAPAPTAFALLPSVGSWLMTRPPIARTPVAAARAGSGAPPAFALMPSVGTWLSSRPRAVAAKAAAAEEMPVVADKGFMFRPSVGTWLAPRLPAPKAAVVAERPTVSFAFKPSVGTWLAPRPKAAAAAESAPRSTPKAATVEVAAKDAAFHLLPSVGTWLAPRPRPTPAPQKASAPWALRPSVGTWLGARPKARAQAPEPRATAPAAGKRQAAFVTTSAALSPATLSLGMPLRMLFL